VKVPAVWHAEEKKLAKVRGPRVQSKTEALKPEHGLER